MPKPSGACRPTVISFQTPHFPSIPSPSEHKSVNTWHRFSGVLPPLYRFHTHCIRCNNPPHSHKHVGFRFLICRAPSLRHGWLRVRRAGPSDASCVIGDPPHLHAVRTLTSGESYGRSYMAGKTAVKKDKAKPVPTNRYCQKCGNRMMSDKVQAVLVLSFEGAKRSSNFFHRHKGCE